MTDIGAPLGDAVTRRAALPPADSGLTGQEKRHARREVLRHRLSALLLVGPLLIFLSFAFIAPIGTMLYRSVHNPGVSELIPVTLESLPDWDGTGLATNATRKQVRLE